MMSFLCFNILCVLLSATSLICGMMTRRRKERSGSATPPSGPSLPSQRPPTASSILGSSPAPRSWASGEDEDEVNAALTKNWWVSSLKSCLVSNVGGLRNTDVCLSCFYLFPVCNCGSKLISFFSERTSNSDIYWPLA